MIKKTSSKESATVSEDRQDVNREVVKSPDCFHVYVNDVQVQTSPWDMRLILGRVDEPATPGKPTVTIKQLGELHMSLELAKRLAMMVIAQLQAYEGRFGRIPAPKDVPEDKPKDTKTLGASTAPSRPSSQ
jgi:Protein of unknown function (DUF3467)